MGYLCSEPATVCIYTHTGPLMYRTFISSTRIFHHTPLNLIWAFHTTKNLTRCFDVALFISRGGFIFYTQPILLFFDFIDEGSDGCGTSVTIGCTAK